MSKRSKAVPSKRFSAAYDNEIVNVSKAEKEFQRLMQSKTPLDPNQRNRIVVDLWYFAGWPFVELSDVFGLDITDIEKVVRQRVRLSNA